MYAACRGVRFCTDSGFIQKRSQLRCRPWDAGTESRPIGSRRGATRQWNHPNVIPTKATRTTAPIRIQAARGFMHHAGCYGARPSADTRGWGQRERWSPTPARRSWSAEQASRDSSDRICRARGNARRAGEHARLITAATTIEFCGGFSKKHTAFVSFSGSDSELSALARRQPSRWFCRSRA
jgi:hypothetical protein